MLGPFLPYIIWIIVAACGFYALYRLPGTTVPTRIRDICLIVWIVLMMFWLMSLAGILGKLW